MKLGQNFRGDKLVETPDLVCVRERAGGFHINTCTALHRFLRCEISVSTRCFFLSSAPSSSLSCSHPPSSAQFFTSHCIVFYAARFLSQQGASFFLSSAPSSSLSRSHPQVLHNSCPLFNTLSQVGKLEEQQYSVCSELCDPLVQNFRLVLYPFVCSEVVTSLRFANFVFCFFWVWFG
jgi:hypothetical protein